MRDHERIEELIAVRALGGLDRPDEAALAEEMAAHGPACEECRRLEAEYGEVAGRLALALDPEPAPEGMEDLVVGLATGSAAPLEATTEVERRRARRRARPGIAVRPLVAVAASVVLFAGGLAIGAAVSGGDDGGPPAGARVVAFQGEPGSGTLSVAFTPGEPGVTIVGAGLPPLPQGQVYEVWTIEGDAPPVPGPCLSPAADGSLFAVADTELGAADTMAVTVEPASCSTEPTTDPVFVADLTTA